MTETLLQRRERLLGNTTLFYDDPVHLVRGEGVWVWDADGRKYLDCYNNVPHVGHCHPKVVEAIATQAATLNTHSRYLHEGVLDYAERLTAQMHPSLTRLMMVCTGSEANDVALRMAEAVTGHRGMIVTDHTYHGNTTAVAALSRTNVARTGDSSWVGFVPAPDAYRGTDADAFTAEVEARIAELQASAHGFAGMMLCPFFANEGFPDVAPGFLDGAVAAVRAAGGMVIADEVQPGFGRLGSHMWGYDYQGIVPDVVTMGKPMGNGHPVAAVVARADVQDAFRETFRYFNTFGGNPVSCAAALAVLDVLEEEELQAQALDVGDYAKNLLQELANKHEIIGNVRGKGMFFGAEFVTDRTAKTPASDLTIQVVEAMRQRGVLLNKVGRNYATLKVRPNLQFTRSHADQLVDTLDQVLGGLT
ncbi:MAG: aminotransferase class III-fold pyridoxal phosphate-dependent enzyme [Pseudomonadota bacterium]